MRVLSVLALALLLTACPPPAVLDEAAPGVTLTSTIGEGFVTYRVDTASPLERLFLRFVGEGLAANAEECELVDAALECIVGAVTSFFEVSVAGTVTNSLDLPFGVACRADCYPLYLANP
jgi:hypothetical protein